MFQNLQVTKDRVDAGKGIEFAVLRPWLIIQCDVEPGKDKRPAGLASIQTFGSTNVLYVKILVICPNHKWNLRPFKPMPLYLQGEIDSKQLFIPNVIVTLRWSKAMGKTAHGCTFSSFLECWERMTPTPTSEASTSTMNWQSRSGCIIIGAEVNRHLRFWKAFSADVNRLTQPEWKWVQWEVQQFLCFNVKLIFQELLDYLAYMISIVRQGTRKKSKCPQGK